MRWVSGATNTRASFGRFNSSAAPLVELETLVRLAGRICVPACRVSVSSETGATAAVAVAADTSYEVHGMRGSFR